MNSAGFGAAAALVVLLLVFGSLLAPRCRCSPPARARKLGRASISLLSHLIDVASFSSSWRC